MKLKAKSADALEYKWGGEKHGIVFPLNFDGTLKVPMVVAIGLIASGLYEALEPMPQTTLRAELSKASWDDLATYIQTLPDPSNPERPLSAKYFEYLVDPLSAELRQAGFHKAADKLDNNIRNQNKGGSGKTCLVEVEALRSYILAYGDAKAAGRPVPTCPWNPDAMHGQKG